MNQTNMNSKKAKNTNKQFINSGDDQIQIKSNRFELFQDEEDAIIIENNNKDNKQVSKLKVKKIKNTSTKSRSKSGSPHNPSNNVNNVNNVNINTKTFNADKNETIDIDNDKKIYEKEKIPISNKNQDKNQKMIKKPENLKVSECKPLFDTIYKYFNEILYLSIKLITAIHSPELIRYCTMLRTLITVHLSYSLACMT